MGASILRVAQALVVVLALFLVQASSSSSSSSASAVRNTTDICSQEEYVNDCWYLVTCKTCLSRAGCAVDVSTGRCMSSSSISEVAATSGSGAQYFLSGEAKYCSSIDPACFSCRRRNAPDVCLGDNDCVCASQCESISTQPSTCKLGTGGSASYGSLLAGSAVLFPLLSYMIFKGSPCSASCSFRRMLRRRRPEKNRRGLPGALELEAWRNHLNERNEPVDDQFADLELRSCFVPMPSTRSHQQQQARAETGDPVHVEARDGDDVSRAVAATDLSLSPTATMVPQRLEEEVTADAQLV